MIGDLEQMADKGKFCGMNLDDIDPTFVDDLIASEPAVIAAAQWLRGKGLAVVTRPTRIRPTPEQRSEFSDFSDLEILQKVEVKHRPKIDFQSPADFPFPSVTVDVCHRYDEAFPKPYAYLILNASLSAAFIVKCETRPMWSRAKKKARGRIRDYYDCPLKFAQFVRIKNDNV